MIRKTAAALACAFASALAWADRPFIASTSAAAEEDDDRVWSIATAFERRRGARQGGVTAEYAFEPTRSIEFTFERASPDGGSGFEVEYKHLFNHIARDGYGWGVALGLGARRDDGGSSWRGGAWSLTLPLSIQFAQTDGLVHLNAGLTREPGARRETLLAAGVEYQAWRRVTLFAEAAREGDDAKLLHAGARWWIRREKIAFDLGATRRRESGETRRGVIVGLAWYDL